MSYDGGQMNPQTCSKRRMRIPNPKIVLSLLLALGTLAGCAKQETVKAPPPVEPAATLPTPPPPPPKPAPVGVPESASAEVHEVARWVVESGDNARLPFVLIDKANAQVLVFNPAGQFQGAAPALLGMARGDRALVPNDATMSQMPPHVRVTPAGRFVSRLAKDTYGKELLVLDYDASLSLHPVVKGKPHERRAERLNSVTSEDNRISFGCINVPVPFYTSIVSPAFTGTKGIVYVLPETGPASALFGFNTAGALASGAQQGSPASDASPGQTVPAPAAK